MARDTNIMAIDLGDEDERERHFKAIFTDAQIEALQKACARMLEDESDWHVNPPTDEERHQLGAAWAVLSNAEVIV